jgi:hypothetical protein
MSSYRLGSHALKVHTFVFPLPQVQIARVRNRRRAFRQYGYAHDPFTGDEFGLERSIIPPAVISCAYHQEAQSCHCRRIVESHERPVDEPIGIVVIPVLLDEDGDVRHSESKDPTWRENPQGFPQKGELLSPWKVLQHVTAVDHAPRVVIEVQPAGASVANSFLSRDALEMELVGLDQPHPGHGLGEQGMGRDQHGHRVIQVHPTRGRSFATSHFHSKIFLVLPPIHLLRISRKAGTQRSELAGPAP